METPKALWHLSANESQLLPVVISPQKKILLKALYSLISIGTERLVAQGQVPPAIAEAMSVPYQEGAFSFPIKYGYALVGEVIQKDHPWEGRLVHLLHPHQNYCAVEENALALVPEGIPAKRATLTSNMETAVNAIWDAQASVGDRVLVAGFGIIGALLAQVLSKIPAIDLWILEQSESRIALARSLGFNILEKKEETAAFDIAFHTTGNEVALQFCIEKIGFAGKVIELSWYGEKDIRLHLGGTFHSQRKQLLSSQVAHLPSDRLPRWDYARRKQVVFELLKDPIFDALINDVIPFEQSPDYFTQLRQGALGALGVCIEY